MMVELPGFSFDRNLNAFFYLCFAEYLSEDVAKRNNARRNAAQELASKAANVRSKANRHRRR